MQIHNHDGINYIRISETDESLQAALSEWMIGQICPLVPGLNPQDAVYSWDWDRFLSLQRGGAIIWD